jgi:formylglycine-generating enzyme required for sulfatase activity
MIGLLMTLFAAPALACAECPEMVVVPAGSFRMGSPAGPGPNGWAPNADEHPQHRVTIAAFELGRTEVTQAQWAAVMGAVPSFNRGAALPVETVSWDDVQIFIARLNERTGRRYRLPTEAEWEYAARAGTTTAFSFGDDPAAIGDFAWYGDNSGKKAHPVATKKPNPFGLNDMHGNVWEWVQDCYRPSYDGAPGDGGTVPDSPGCERVIRDGSGVDYPKSLRVAERYRNAPDYRNGNLGFRLARGLP